MRTFLEHVSLPFLSLAWIALALASLTAAATLINEPYPSQFQQAWVWFVAGYWAVMTLLLIVKFCWRAKPDAKIRRPI